MNDEWEKAIEEKGGDSFVPSCRLCRVPYGNFGIRMRHSGVDGPASNPILCVCLLSFCAAVRCSRLFTQKIVTHTACR